MFISVFYIGMIIKMRARIIREFKEIKREVYVQRVLAVSRSEKLFLSPLKF